MASGKDYILLADAMRRVVNNFGPDNATAAQFVFSRLSDELAERFPNFDKEKFNKAIRP